MDWLLNSGILLLKTAASTVLIAIVLLLLVRTFGLRSFAKISAVDFASTIAIGSVLASVVTGTGTSVLQGAVAIATLMGFQNLFSWVKRHSDGVEAFAENDPVFLMIGSEIQQDALDRVGITRADLMGKLREANVLQLADVKAVVFETTGDVSVLHGEGNKVVDEMILADVLR